MRQTQPGQPRKERGVGVGPSGEVPGAHGILGGEQQHRELRGRGEGQVPDSVCVWRDVTLLCPPPQLPNPGMEPPGTVV